jgi:hypothetical protein
MARQATATDGSRILVQGFQWGGGINLPYIYCGILNTEGHLVAEFTLGVGQANELGEYLRQEAEAASGSRNEVGE